MWILYLFLFAFAIAAAVTLSALISLLPIMFVDWMMLPIGGSPLLGHFFFGAVTGGSIGLSIGLRRIGRNEQARWLLWGLMAVLGIAFVVFLGDLL